MQSDLIVLGGGAAGFFGALHAKEQDPTLNITLLEAAPACLGKVKISGGGRCNVTHHCHDLARLVSFYPRGQQALKGIFSRFAPKDTIRWFESHGVKLKTEADGRMFPVTDDSQTIIDCLIGEARRLGILLQTRCRVERVVPYENGYRIETNGQPYQARAILVATGNARAGHTWATDLGHQLVEPVASLFTFKINDAALTALAGVSVPHVTAWLKVAGEKPIEQSGPLLITHWGLSGPVILRLSAWGARLLHQANYQGQVLIDFLPNEALSTLLEKLHSQKADAAPMRQIGNDAFETLPKRFWHYLLTASQMDPSQPWREVSQKALNRVGENLKRFPLDIAGKGQFKDEFVTAGGVALKQIDCRTMQSKVSPGCFWAGEILDIDGMTGGFNFQNAWSTGYIAAEGIVKYLKEAS